MKGLKENIQDKKRKLEHSNTHSSSSKPEAFKKNSPKKAQTHPDETTLGWLGFFSSNSPKRAQALPGEKSLSPTPTRLNMRRETQP